MSTPVTSGWWARRWQALLKDLGVEGDAGSLRGCRVKRLEVTPGLILAQVQDRELGAAAIEVHLPVLDDAQWDRVLQALAGQALYAAQLLAGNMPAELEAMFVQAGAALLPAAAEIVQQCSACPPGERPCRPLAAVYWQLNEMLAEDPWLLLRLRGRDQQQVLAAIHMRRNSASPENGNRPAAPAVAVEAAKGAFYTPGDQALAARHEEAHPALDAQMEAYWGRRKAIEEMHHHLVRPAVELALLRRLGPLTASSEGATAFSQLQAVYRRVTDRVWALAFAPEEYEAVHGDGNGTENGTIERG
jgi:uncharacterized Zn finger protein